MKRARAKQRVQADAVLTEIVRNGVIAVTEEMKTNLMRTAYNMIVYEALDFTVGLYTAEGETVSIGLGLPSFIRGMAETVKAKLRHFGKDGLQPGDILVTNDAYTTGSHLYHFTFSLPIFHQEKLSGFACCMAHWTDVGGVLGGVTTDIYSEGLQIPIVKYASAGVVNQGEEMTIDLSQMSPQVRGFYNSGATTGYSCAQVAYKCLTSPADYPINEGSFRPLKVILAPGTVVSAVKPAAMRWWMTFPMTVVDTVFRALEKAIPDRTIAAHHADLLVCLINGISPKDGRLFLAGIGPSGGGFGAKLTEDGVSATVCLNDGDTHNHPVEQMEAKYPVLFERHALREDSGGAGRYRGGLGTEQVVQARAPININVQVDRVHCAPWGLAGGQSGAGNQVCLRIGGQEISDLPNAKVLMKKLNPGDPITLRAGGGGGFRPPAEPDPAKGAHAARQGYG